MEDILNNSDYFKQPSYIIQLKEMKQLVVWAKVLRNVYLSTENNTKTNNKKIRFWYKLKGIAYQIGIADNDYEFTPEQLGELAEYVQTKLPHSADDYIKNLKTMQNTKQWINSLEIRMAELMGYKTYVQELNRYQQEYQAQRQAKINNANSNNTKLTREEQAMRIVEDAIRARAPFENSLVGDTSVINLLFAKYSLKVSNVTKGYFNKNALGVKFNNAFTPQETIVYECDKGHTPTALTHSAIIALIMLISQKVN